MSPETNLHSLFFISTFCQLFFRLLLCRLIFYQLLFIESLQQNDHRRVCSSFGCITSRAQSRIAVHRPGTDHGPEENWEKKRKKKRWPGVQAPCLEFARMGWKAWELNFVRQDSRESPHLSIDRRQPRPAKADLHLFG